MAEGFQSFGRRQNYPAQDHLDVVPKNFFLLFGVGPPYFIIIQYVRPIFPSNIQFESDFFWRLITQMDT